MKIISKFQDYYDCGVAYGVDEKIYFKRETADWKNLGKVSHYKDKRLETVILSDGSVYFCGKQYKYKLRRTSKTGKAIRTEEFNTETADYKFYYTLEQYQEDYPKKKTRYRRYSWGEPIPDAEYFKVKEVPDDEFIERGVPYFIGNKNLPILKDYQFIKAVDPMVAFQEISMYLGRLTNPESECEIDEKYRKAGHGMDCMSYRKEGKNKKSCK